MSAHSRLGLLLSAPMLSPYNISLLIYTILTHDWAQCIIHPSHTDAAPGPSSQSLTSRDKRAASLASCQLTIRECKFPTKPLSTRLRALIPLHNAYGDEDKRGRDWWIQSSCLHLHIMPIRIIFSILRTKYHCDRSRGSNDMKDYTLLRLLYFHSFSISD